MKRLIRNLSAALVLSLAVTAFPVSAGFGDDDGIDWGDNGFDDYLGTYVMEWTYGSPYDSLSALKDFGAAFEKHRPRQSSARKDVTVSMPDHVVCRNGAYYDPMGIHVNAYVKDENGVVISEIEDYPNRQDIVPVLQNAPLNNGVYTVTIPKCPEDTVGKQKWLDTYRPIMNQVMPSGETYRVRCETVIMLVYAPHVHDTTGYGWSYDENCHWTYCTRCPQFVDLNWHHDIDNDGVCDQCSQPITYRKLTVQESEGGKVTLSADKAKLGSRIAVTVEPEPGYRLESLRAQNANGDKYSIRPCYEDIKGSQYHFIVDVFDVDVIPSFVKE